ncbi:ATP-binding cassette domain-containing protein [Microbacterium sp.]|uniref:ATP-binding cassette domain-containing protein n=1 Tax=Microbacterium sp. TaxID=51671 RepID=UPI0025E48C43|nr:ATP-binding cassette domain-containing protein [Microbacterium sp.]
MSIRAEQIDYSYGRRRVLHSLDLDVGVGATLLLGPNGAGKSTLLEVLASVRRAARGSVTIAGVGAPGPDRAALQRYRRAVAWLPQTVTPYPGVRVREHVALAGWLKGMSKAEAWEASARALEQVALSDKATDPVKSLSGGQTRRLGIAGALVHDARVILLDEPTASLDPAQRRRFRSVIEPIAAERTVLISSHDTQEVAASFDSVVVLAEGRMRFAGTVEAFLRVSPSSASDTDRIELAYVHWAGGVE